MQMRMQMEDMVGAFIDVQEKVAANEVPENSGFTVNDELEVRILRKSRLFDKDVEISASNKDDVRDWLIMNGFRCVSPEGQIMLRIILDEGGGGGGDANAGGSSQKRNIRLEINELDAIRQYCKRDEDLNTAFADPVYHDKFCLTQKEKVENLNDVFNDDFNFKVSYKRERQMRATHLFLSNGSGGAAGGDSAVDERWFTGISIPQMQHIYNSWPAQKKLYRFMNRVTFVHPKHPIKVDISTVKSSKQMLPEKSLRAAGVFSNVEQYEIEIEIDNHRVRKLFDFAARTDDKRAVNVADVKKKVLFSLRRCIQFVLGGIQGCSAFPIGNEEKQFVLDSYMAMIAEKTIIGGFSGQQQPQPQPQPQKKPPNAPRFLFIGPSPVTLQLTHIASLSEIITDSEESFPNIREQYTVTEKADGVRKMLFVCGRKPLVKTTDNYADETDAQTRMYLLDTNGDVAFTGYTVSEKYATTLLDGEWIGRRSSSGKWINCFLAFDVYFFQNELTMDAPLFLPDMDDEDKESLMIDPSAVVPPPDAAQSGGGANSSPQKRISRYQIVKQFIDYVSLHAQSVVSPSLVAASKTNISFAYKHYLYGDGETIFQQARELWVEQRFQYDIDGLIFTPAALGVHGSRADMQSREVFHKKTWNYLLKWKPIEKNTIDFYVTFQRHLPDPAAAGDANAAAAAAAATEWTERRGDVVFKCLELKCGANTNVFNGGGDYNPWQMMIYGVPPNSTSPINRNYHAIPFVPIDPPNMTAYRCILPCSAADGQVYTTVDKEVIRDNYVVEFAYDKSSSPDRAWIPLRVRHDKMAEKSFGNSFRTANDNWYSIHNEVTTEMITSGLKTVPTFAQLRAQKLNDSCLFEYYLHPEDPNRRMTSPTLRLRNFHNLVKAWLLNKCVPDKSIYGLKLIDLAMGKGGDICKWTNMPQLQFALGLDISPQNIYGLKDGACQRYIRLKKIHEQKRSIAGQPPSSSFLNAAFLVADVTKNILETQEAVTAVWTHMHDMTSSNTNGNLAAVTAADRGKWEDARERNALLLKGILNDSSKLSDEEKQWVPAHLQEAALGKFDICSCQFAIHYFCKNITTFHQFLRNVTECTKMKGFFVGTCLDGDKLHKLFFRRAPDPDMEIASPLAAPHIHYTLCDEDKRVIFCARKKYTDADAKTNTLPANEFSLGLGIDVFQESVGNSFEEYLVSFPFLVSQMAKYGFDAVPLDLTTTQRISHLDFETMYQLRTAIMKECNYETNVEMTAAEKELSFLNRAFVFQKVREPLNGRTAEQIATQSIEDGLRFLKDPSISIVDVSGGLLAQMKKQDKRKRKDNAAEAVVANLVPKLKKMKKAKE